MGGFYQKLTKLEDLEWTPIPQPSRWHWSRLVIPPLTWILDRLQRCSTADDIDGWAARKGWWHRG